MVVGEAKGAEARQRVGSSVCGVGAAGAHDGRDIGLWVLLEVESGVRLVGIDWPIPLARGGCEGVDGVYRICADCGVAGGGYR